MFVFFFFNDTATTEIYTLSLHDALPILPGPACFSTNGSCSPRHCISRSRSQRTETSPSIRSSTNTSARSEEHTSELQSRQYLVCRLLLEKKKHIHQQHVT